MAGNFTNSFTGKGTGIVLPSGEGLQRSQENLSQMLLSAEKLKADVFRKNAEQFQKDINIDPVLLLSQASQDAQGELLRDWTKENSGLLQKYNGNIPEQEKTRMNMKKNVIIMEQQKMQADMQRALQDRDILSKDVYGRLDHEEADARWNDYLRKGKYDASPLQPRGVSLGDIYNKATEKVNGTPSNVTVAKKINGIDYKETYQSSGSEAEADEDIKTKIISRPEVAKQTIKEFLALKTEDPATYKKYIDINGDGVISPDEEKQASYASNPIVKWAQDTYRHKALDMKLSQPTKVNTGGNTTFNWKLGVSASHNLNDKYATQSDYAVTTDEGTFNYPDYKDLGQTKVSTTSQTIKRVFIKDANGNETLKPLNESTRFDVIGYSPSKDQVILKLTDNTSGYSYMKDAHLVAPAEDFNDLLKNKYGIFRSQQPQATQVVKKKPY